MECPACHEDMIKSKVGWLCLSCGNLVPVHHADHAKSAPTAAKPDEKPTIKPAALRPRLTPHKTVSDLKSTPQPRTHHPASHPAPKTDH